MEGALDVLDTVRGGFCVAKDNWGWFKAFEAVLKVWSKKKSKLGSLMATLLVPYGLIR